MQDDDLKTQKRQKVLRLLWLDAWLDSSLYNLKFKLADVWEAVSIKSRRMKVTGPLRLVIEVLDEAFSIGVAGFVLLLALALPAFEETVGDWRSKTDISVTFLDRYGTLIGKRGILYKDGVPLDQMPDHVVKAVLATEDRRFFDHYGIDFFGLSRALSENVRANGVVQGGSTITQQLAKNLFLTNERTLERKVKEAFLAVWLEANMSKKEILQLYLDRAYMGGGTFGILAASDFYFDKSIKDVTLAEAAMLAGLFKSPAKYAPHINLPAARARANEVLSNMVQASFLTEGQVIGARRNPANVIDRVGAKSPDYFLDWAFEEVKKVAGTLNLSSLVVKTTVDIDLQNAAEEAVEFHLRQFGEEYNVTQAGIVMMETDGSVRAIVGGRDYGTSQFNRATKAQRQAGSSFKPYVYATAMENGFDPESIVPDAPVSWGSWSPQNYNRGYAGRINLTTALVKSINTVPVRLTQKLTTTAVAATAKAMGVESEISLHKTMSLGTSGLTVMDQATGYLTFAANGYANTRHAFTQIYSNSGEIVWDIEKNGGKPKKVLSDTAVASMNTILAQIPEWGTARRAALPGMRSAGKTGTTQSYRDAWYVGFTGNYVAAVWFGNDDFRATEKLTGGLLPAMTWQRLMSYAHQNVELRPIPGLEQPFLTVEEKPVEKQKNAKDSAVGEQEIVRTRPVVLNSTTSKLLQKLNEKFIAAPALSAPKDLTTSSIGN